MLFLLQITHRLKGGFVSSIKKLFVALLYKARLSADVYILLFLCDFINFFVLLFGFPEFMVSPFFPFNNNIHTFHFMLMCIFQLLFSIGKIIPKVFLKHL